MGKLTKQASNITGSNSWTRKVVKAVSNVGDQVGLGSNTLVSQVANPFRKQLENYGNGAGQNLGDVLDPNSRLHSQNKNTTKQVNENNATYQQNLANDAEAARIRAIAPSEDSEGVAAAKRRALLRSQGRSGRQSTILTGGAADTLG
jgi:hypothetical protein